MIYANAAGTSWPKPAVVAEAVQRALLASPGDNADLYRAGHRAVQRFFGIPDASADRLLLAPSCTSALAVALGDRIWNEGDVVITSSLEHHALARPVQKLSWERGVEHVRAPYHAHHAIDLAFVEQRLRQGGVKLLAVTAASNVTGEILPIADLARLAHRYGAEILVDAAQTAGLLPLDVHELDLDMLVFAGHKAMLGPLGIGGLWARESVRFTCPTATCEAGPANGLEARAPYPGFCDLGSVNFPALAGLTAAIEWLGQRSDEQREHPRRLARRLFSACKERPHCQLLGGDGDRTATVSFALEHVALTDAQRHFRDHGIAVRAGTHCAPMALETMALETMALETMALERTAPQRMAPQKAVFRDGCIRVSFGPHNVDADVDAVLAAIDAGSPADAD